MLYTNISHIKCKYNVNVKCKRYRINNYTLLSYDIILVGNYCANKEFCISSTYQLIVITFIYVVLLQNPLLQFPIEPYYNANIKIKYSINFTKEFV